MISRPARRSSGHASRVWDPFRPDNFANIFLRQAIRKALMECLGESRLLKPCTAAEVIATSRAISVPRPKCACRTQSTGTRQPCSHAGCREVNGSSERAPYNVGNAAAGDRRGVRPPGFHVQSWLATAPGPQRGNLRCCMIVAKWVEMRPFYRGFLTNPSGLDACAPLEGGNPAGGRASVIAAGHPVHGRSGLRPQ